MQALILGGARSGKSRYAETLARASALEVVYIATATAQDQEMQARIQQHQADRPVVWKTVEEPLALAQTLVEQAHPKRLLLVDCLTLWLTHLLCQGQDSHLAQETAALFEVLPKLPGQLLLVSNEVGQGIVPLGELSRRYVDEAGRLHQRLAAQVDYVALLVAGLPLTVKGEWR